VLKLPTLENARWNMADREHSIHAAVGINMPGAASLPDHTHMAKAIADKLSECDELNADQISRIKRALYGDHKAVPHVPGLLDAASDQEFDDMLKECYKQWAEFPTWTAYFKKEHEVIFCLKLTEAARRRMGLVLPTGAVGRPFSQGVESLHRLG